MLSDPSSENLKLSRRCLVLCISGSVCDSLMMVERTVVENDAPRHEATYIELEEMSRKRMSKE